jgi:RHS repeat-associated protein
LRNGSYGAGYGFTGEQTDPNDLLYLRARYDDPSLGVFTGRDPLEGTMHNPLSINGYSWVD